MRRVPLLLALALLCACTPRFQGNGDIRPTLNRAQIEAQGVPVLFISIPALDASASTRVSGRNGSVVTWRTVDGKTVSLDHGVLVATRGLGQDLMTATATEIRRAGKDGGSPRVYSWLDAEHRTVFETVICRTVSRGPVTFDSLGVQRDTTLVREECGNPDRAFTNEYYIGPDGTIWKSRQWAGPGIDHVITELLVR